MYDILPPDLSLASYTQQTSPCMKIIIERLTTVRIVHTYVYFVKMRTGNNCYLGISLSHDFFLLLSMHSDVC